MKIVLFRQTVMKEIWMKYNIYVSFHSIIPSELIIDLNRAGDMKISSVHVAENNNNCKFSVTCVTLPIHHINLQLLLPITSIVMQKIFKTKRQV